MLFSKKAKKNRNILKLRTLFAANYENLEVQYKNFILFTKSKKITK